MKVLVTGADGFIGSHLAERLVGRRHEVRAVDNFSTGKRENLATCIDEVDFVEADLADPEACAMVVAGIETAFHLAGIPSIPWSMAEPLRTHRANVGATFQLFETSVAAGVRRVVYSSSSSVYDNAVDLPKTEQMSAGRGPSTRCRSMSGSYSGSSTPSITPRSRRTRSRTGS